MNRALVAAALAGLVGACGEPPQKIDEAAVSFRAGFSAEPGVMTKVVFPWIADGAAAAAEAGLVVTDGGTAKLEMTIDGMGLAVVGQGAVSVTYSNSRATGVGGEKGIPQAQLTRGVPDAGMDELYVTVNKGGSGSAQVNFEYAASRDCGAGCGGKRSWTFEGPVGLSRQNVLMSFSEEKR